MSEYKVYIQAIITKVIRVEADNADEAYNIAHDLFDPYSGKDEAGHDQLTLDIIEVQS